VNYASPREEREERERRGRERGGGQGKPVGLCPQGGESGTKAWSLWKWDGDARGDHSHSGDGVQVILVRSCAGALSSGLSIRCRLKQSGMCSFSSGRLKKNPLCFFFFFFLFSFAFGKAMPSPPKLCWLPEPWWCSLYNAGISTAWSPSGILTFIYIEIKSVKIWCIWFGI